MVTYNDEVLLIVTYQSIVAAAQRSKRAGCCTATRGCSLRLAKPLWRRRQMDAAMKVADLGVDPRITAILKE